MPTGLTGAQASLVGSTLAAALPDAVRKVYSNEILFQALPSLRWFQFCVTRQEIGKVKGQTIQMLRYAPLDLGGKLTEGTPLTHKTMSATPGLVSVWDDPGPVTPGCLGSLSG